jgi:hypothetical protein
MRRPLTTPRGRAAARSGCAPGAQNAAIARLCSSFFSQQLSFESPMPRSWPNPALLSHRDSVRQA